MVPLQPYRSERVTLGRRLGQHFLKSHSVLERIAAAACAERAHVVVEIGPGRGALTECLLARAGRVASIELDPVLVHYLRHKFRDAIERGRLELIEGDILKTDLTGMGASLALTGSLPYYITSPILEKTFALGMNWERAVYLVQAEVAARVTAAAGTREFGYLSVLVQTQARAETLFEVPSQAFRPPPKVASAVVRLTPRDTAADFHITGVPAFLQFARHSFRQKRKTLRNNLAPVYGAEKIEGLPEARLRAEQLGVAELAALYRKVCRV